MSTGCYPTVFANLRRQSYIPLPHAHRCAHGLSTTGRCWDCGTYPHSGGCDTDRLDHGTVARHDNTRYLFVWLYQDEATAEEWAAEYATVHGLDYRINHPDDLELYCPGVVSIRYHRNGAVNASAAA